MYNIIIVGAKDPNNSINNINQASHLDLCKIKNMYKNININCYDMLYDSNYELDDIQYKIERFDFYNLDFFKKDSINIIIEFCNLLDENDINNNRYINNEQLYNYKIIYLACGCSWNKGFPIECLYFIFENNNIYTPINVNDVDSYLYIISSVHSIYQENIEYVMEPYLKGLYHIMGTLKWRGCNSNNYEHEDILRKLFILIELDDIKEISDIDKNDLELFISYEKHWNELKWSVRENITKFIYGKNNLV